MLPMKFRVKWPFSSGEEEKNRFSRWLSWRPSCILIGTILAIFVIQVTLMLPTYIRVNKPFGSGEEVKNRFLRWPPWWPSWISIRNHFNHFLSLSHPDASDQISSQLAFGFRRRSEKKIFKMATMGAILDF